MSDDQREEEKPGILSSVSLTTVIASALAAGTSLVLSSKIGLAGSVIGTVVAAAASSFATQIYQSILKKSAEKVRDVTNLTADLGSSEEDEATNGKVADRPHDGKTVAQRRPVTLSDKTGPQERADTGTPIAPDSIRYAAHARENKAATKRALVVAVAAALVALAVTAGIITLATAGQGLGTTTAFTPATTSTDDGTADQQATQTEQTDSADAAQTDQQTDQAQATDQTNTSGTADGTTDNSGTSSGTSTDAGTGTSTDSSSTTGDSSNSSNGTGGATSGGATNGTTSDSGTTGGAASGDSTSGTGTTDATTTAQ